MDLAYGLLDEFVVAARHRNPAGFAFYAPVDPKAPKESDDAGVDMAPGIEPQSLKQRRFVDIGRDAAGTLPINNTKSVFEHEHVVSVRIAVT